MSGRSAYVRKKITETKANEKNSIGRGRARSTTSSEDTATLSDYNMSMRQNTGIGTTNGRFLKFSEPIRASEPVDFSHMGYGQPSTGSQNGSSGDDRRDGGQGPPLPRPLDDFAYARARRPNIRTEDVSGIEKSGLRSAVDKKSDDVRRGLVKAFTFGKKNKSNDEKNGNQFRPPSAATVRPPMGSSINESELDLAIDAHDMGPHDMGPRDMGPREMGSNVGSLHQQIQQQHQQMMMMQERHRHQQLPQSPVDSQPGGWDGGSHLSPPPSSKLPPLPPASNSVPIKRWIGSGRPVQRWNKLRKDPELWDPNGDVLVFFGYKGQQPRPNPSFRLSSHIIEATESRFLITLLREGSTEEDIQLPPSPIGAPPMLQRHMASGGGSGGHLGPHSHGRGHGHGGYGMGQPTPPISEDASLVDVDGQISYEMYFPTPPNMNKVDQLRHHITTRNIFALLYHASLVGLSLYQALADLHARLEAYMPPEMDNVGTIINYLGARGIDDIRNDPESAISLLAWSESPDVRWEEGWRESFLHSTGMYASLESCADFKNVTPITRALLERACLETQLRVQAAEERLAEFQFADMWPPALATTASSSGPVQPSPAKAAGDRLQKFLLQHYTRTYGRWPPLPPSPTAASLGVHVDAEDDIWLTRTIAQALQKDFAALYDYLVDRDIVWDGSEARSGRKWMLVSQSGNKAFEADTLDLPMTDMLVEFDNKLRFPHIPHPFPLVPDSIPPSAPSSGKEKGKKGDAAPTGTGNRAGSVERRVQLAYTVATNMLILGSDFNQSDLIDAFSKFEKVDRVGEVDPLTARRGRWVLIYGILQTLASVSVDALNMRYRDGVSYHLSPRLKGAKMPPWRTTGGGGGLVGSSDEAAHELSHCWIVPRTWNMGHPNNHGGHSSAHQSGNEESSAASSSASGNNSPVRRSSIIFGSSNSNAGGGFNFPRPPPADTLTVRSGSSAGFHTPHGGRSVRSSTSLGPSSNAGGDGLGSDLAPPFGAFGTYTQSSHGGAASVVSSASAMSDLSSNTRPRKGNGPSSKTATSRSGVNAGGSGGVYGGANPNVNMSLNMGMSIGIPTVEEAGWPMTLSSGEVAASSGSGRRNAHGGPPVLPGLKGIPHMASSGNGGFLLMDESQDESHSNYTTDGSGSERRRRRRQDKGGREGRDGREDWGGSSTRSKARTQRPLMNQGDAVGSVAPVIRDFDALDVIDDHEP
ncbi:uncharacterized protein SPSK_02973 [Sporothrix schenckii 1099-18]|uniref:DUF8004 domain-containing protein n=1 Tax=Sporothrix schenckii 1099-18 TaxID=1397361 RepID=A0A0F2LZX7_SPOSC|nr:uncharacterized protein SPSK_02973 [Sporothrix schenckii 1099-18]KJR82404.1 hypothetical protein SPSK_02973 [Sporothrix schenckii 1099-18]